MASARDRLEHANPESRHLPYHASPFQVAFDLAGSSMTDLEEDDLSTDRTIIERFDPARYPPRQ